ncbi:MAG: hypothetical protein O7H41_12170 [Planctomycetota bacterium]|nr:hypothetical protein [Planctomycetota bacterium]
MSAALAGFCGELPVWGDPRKQSLLSDPLATLPTENHQTEEFNRVVLEANTRSWRSSTVGEEHVVRPPVYLVHSSMTCWKCGAPQVVVAIAAHNVEGLEDTVSVFSEVTSLPKELLAHMRKRCPTYRLRYSRTAEMRYFANTCGSCAALFGDFYLHSEPGGAFFPDSEEAAARMSVEVLPVRGEIRIAGWLGTGLGEIIMQCAMRPGPVERA